MNTITRIVLVVWILLLVFRHPRAHLFLIVALVVIALLYYARRRAQQKEHVKNLIKMLAVHANHELHELKQKGSQLQSRVEDSESDSSDSDDESSDSVRSRHRRERGNRSKHRVRGGHRSQNGSSDRFERFKATAGNDRSKTVTAPPSQRDATVYEEVDDADAAPDDLPDEEEVDVDQELVEAPTGRRAGAGTKRNPRKPYPPIVSPSVEVRAARQANLMKAYRGPDVRVGSKYHGYQTKNFEDDEGPSIRYTNRRLRGVPKEPEVQTAQPAIEERYEVMAENDDAEIEDEVVEQDIPDDDDIEEPEPVQMTHQAAVPKKRIFLPANYDSSSAPPVPVPKNDKPKMTRHGARGGRRVPTKWGDNNQVSGRMDASDLMFNRAAKLEKKTNARLRADRGSQINSVFGI